MSLSNLGCSCRSGGSFVLLLALALLFHTATASSCPKQTPENVLIRYAFALTLNQPQVVTPVDMKCIEEKREQRKWLLVDDWKKHDVGKPITEDSAKKLATLLADKTKYEMLREKDPQTVKIFDVAWLLRAILSLYGPWIDLATDHLHKDASDPEYADWLMKLKALPYKPEIDDVAAAKAAKEMKAKFVKIVQELAKREEPLSGTTAGNWQETTLGYMYTILQQTSFLLRKFLMPPRNYSLPDMHRVWPDIKRLPKDQQKDLLTMPPRPFPFSLPSGDTKTKGVSSPLEASGGSGRASPLHSAAATRGSHSTGRRASPR